MLKQLHPDTLRLEVRILGPLLFAIPIAIVLIFATFTLLMFMGQVVHGFIASLLIALLEAILPLATGLVLATLAVHDASLELLLTTTTSYRRIAFLRFFLIIIWTMLVELIATYLLYITLPWVSPVPFWTAQLTWLPPTLWLASAGVALALLLRSRTACGAILGSLWIVQLAFHHYFTNYGWLQPWFLFASLYAPKSSFWPANRVELLIGGLLFFLISWWYLGHTEWRFFGEDA